MLPELQRIFVLFAERAAKGQQIVYDPYEPAVQEWISQHAFELAKDIVDTTVKALRISLQQGWDAGEGIEGLAARVRQVFDQATKYRSFLIARTETTAAANIAQISVMGRAGIQYKQWLTGRDERVCPLCGGLEGKEVPIDEEFAPGIFSPPAHPGCRCTVLSGGSFERIAKYPGQPRDEKGRFAEGKVTVRIKSPGRNATEAQKKTLKALDEMGPEGLAAAIEECKTYSMPDRKARSHVVRHKEIGARDADSYVLQAQQVVADPERVFAWVKSKVVYIGFTARSQSSNWRVVVCSVGERAVKSLYGPDRKNPISLDATVRERRDQGWVELMIDDGSSS